MKLRFVLIVAFILFVPRHVIGQDTIVKKGKKFSVLPLPSFGYSPETKTYVGAVALFTLNLYDDSLTRTSNAKTEFVYTWNRQAIMDIGWEYFFKEEDWFTKGLLHFSDYPDLFYGIGAFTSQSNEQYFESKRVSLKVDILKKIYPKLYVGFGGRYINYRIPGDLEPLSEESIGGKFSLVWDNRNNLLTPTKGSYIGISNTQNWSANYYTQIELDMRKYLTFKKGLETIAMRFYHLSVMGNAPFYDLATIGGDKIVRGYRFGRYRTNNLTNAQIELRSAKIWRFGLAAFGGSALVFDNFKDISKTNLKPNIGLGLRFLVDKNENTSLRFDYAIGQQGQNGFYISFGESF
jgi:outer membrane protein assembly factor BamA